MNTDQVWMQETTLHPLAALMAAIAAGVILFGSRERAVMAFLVLATCVSGAQNFNLFGTSWYLLRLLILCGAIRCTVRNDWRSVTWGNIDWCVVAWSAIGTLIYVAQRGDPSALTFKIGTLVDTAGAYFVFRGLIQSQEAVYQAIRSLALIAIPVAIGFSFEYATRMNVFSVFGGVPLMTTVRDGKLRCQGAFAHPILAGVFWAANLPAFIALIITKRARVVGYIGVFASLIIVVTCSSSTPIMGIAFGLLGVGCFALRKHMRVVQIGVVLMVCVLHMVMKAPVWHLLARADIVGGSTGHYRYMLVDATIRHFDEWCILGLASNLHWGKEYGHYLGDITNQYVLEALRGGAVTLTLFVAISVFAFGIIGRHLKTTRHSSQQWLAWCIGTSLFVHLASFTAVSYFGQIVLIYNMHIAMICGTVCIATQPQYRVAKLKRIHIERQIHAYQ